MRGLPPGASLSKVWVETPNAIWELGFGSWELGFRLVMRKGGLEPPRYCYRQPLKLDDLRADVNCRVF